jgi:3-methyladenine DNA glycosylase AlkD
MHDLSTSDEILAEMRTLANPSARQGMERFGIQAENLIGLSVPQIRLIARRTARSQRLAEELWNTEIHDARLLASLVADPDVISEATMDKWVRDTNSWDVCDSCSGNLFDKSPHAWKKIRQWAGDDREFVRRAAFATIAGVAVHDKSAPDSVFVKALPLIEKYSFDDRNFARKGINWALRSIGKRNPALRKAAIACAERVRDQGTKASRWIGTDALRELKQR